MGREPYCGNCGYQLTGLTESSRCPECGRPLVEVLERGPRMVLGRRYKSDIVLFGLPLVHIALGPSERDGERIGRARGIIAIGDEAVGWFAFGGFARGLFAAGGFALGVVSMGGFSLGLLSAGGMALGGVALGGGAVGLIAKGGGAIGYIATGGGAAGHWVHAGGGWGTFVHAGNRSDPRAKEFFDRYHEIFGAAPQEGLRYQILALVWFAGLASVVLVPAALLVLMAYIRRQRQVRGP